MLARAHERAAHFLAEVLGHVGRHRNDVAKHIGYGFVRDAVAVVSHVVTHRDRFHGREQRVLGLRQRFAPAPSFLFRHVLALFNSCTTLTVKEGTEAPDAIIAWGVKCGAWGPPDLSRRKNGGPLGGNGAGWMEGGAATSAYSPSARFARRGSMSEVEFGPGSHRPTFEPVPLTPTGLQRLSKTCTTADTRD
jgi:hypothetical protein